MSSSNNLIWLAVGLGIVYYADLKGYIKLGLAERLGNFDPTPNVIKEPSPAPVVTSPNSPPQIPSTTSPTSSPSPGGTGLDGSNDKFGVKKIYKSAFGGQRDWYFGDFSRWRNASQPSKSGDGWSHGPRSRLIIVPFGGMGSSSECNHATLAARGYWTLPTNWKNVEMTIYAKYGGKGSGATHGGQSIHCYVRSLGHNTVCGGCMGASYNNEVYLDQDAIRHSIEPIHAYKGSGCGPTLQHKNGVGTGAPATGKYIGFKSIVYNMKNTHGTGFPESVMQEAWSDPQGNNQWKKVSSREDYGQIMTCNPDCKAKRGQPLTWGGPECVFRWDATNVVYKNMSVREIAAT